VDLEAVKRGVYHFYGASEPYHLINKAHPTMRDHPGMLGQLIGDVRSAEQSAFRVGSTLGLVLRLAKSTYTAEYWAPYSSGSSGLSRNGAHFGGGYGT
jgi:hypothetical protein